MLSSHPTIKVDKNGPPIISFSSAPLKPEGVKGVLKADEHGYRQCVLSVLNIYNTSGAWYPGSKSNIDIFDPKLSPNTLMAKRLAKRRLAGENGHPKMLPGMTREQYKFRCMEIYEENVIAHFREIIIDTRNYKDEEGKPIIAILGEVAPAGPHAAMLEKAFLNPHEDVCWSIRSLSKSTFHTGREERFFTDVWTWDKVNDPGKDRASKFSSLNLESAAEHGVFVPDFTITVSELEELVKIREIEGLTCESAAGQDVRIILENMKAMKSDVLVDPNGWLNW